MPGKGHQIVAIGCATDVTFVEQIATFDAPRKIRRGTEFAVDVTLDAALAPALVLMGESDHVPFARFEFELNAMLKRFLFQFRTRYHQTIANEMCRVTVTCRRAERVEMRFLLFDRPVHHRIDAKPSSNGETVLVRPRLDRRKDETGTISTWKIEKFIRTVTVRKTFQDVQQFHRVLFLEERTVFSHIAVDSTTFVLPKFDFRFSDSEEKVSVDGR